MGQNSSCDSLRSGSGKVPRKATELKRCMVTERRRSKKQVSRLSPVDVVSFNYYYYYDAAVYQLFVSIASNPHHVLKRLYHERKVSGDNLRTGLHNFALPAKDDYLPAIVRIT